jgi:hypothetical protein
LQSNGIFTQSPSATSKIGRTTKPVHVNCYIYNALNRCKAPLPLHQVYTNLHRQRCELFHSIKVRSKMVLSCRSERNPRISDTQFVMYPVLSLQYPISSLYRPNCSAIRARQAWYCPRCILSTVVRDSCEPRSMVLMLTQRNRTRGLHPPFDRHRHASSVRPLNVPNPVRIQHSRQYHAVM